MLQSFYKARIFVILILASFLFFNPSLASGQTSSFKSRKLSLSDALQIANLQQIDIVIARERIQQALARIAQARAPLLPQLNATSYQTRHIKNLEAMGISNPFQGPLTNPFNSFDARLSLTQSIFDPVTLARLQTAKLGREFAEAEMEKTREDTLTLVAVLYLRAHRAQQTLQSLRTKHKFLEKEIRLAGLKLQTGMGTQLEITQKKAQISQSEMEVANAQKETDQTRLDLLQALGLSAEESLTFTSSSIPTLPPSADQTHPDLMMASKGVELRESELKASTKEYLPQLEAMADYGASGTHPSHVEGTYTVGAQLQIPLFNGGARPAKIREIKSQTQEAKDRLENTQNQIEIKIANAKLALKSVDSFLKAAKAQLQSARQHQSIVHSQQENGLGTSFESIEADIQLIQSQEGMDDAQNLYSLAQVHLLHAEGRMRSMIHKQAVPAPSAKSKGSFK